MIDDSHRLSVGSPAGLVIRRPDKLEHCHTVLYEIDMLRFAYDGMFLLQGDADRLGDLWVYLESFLVHYRNLLGFFVKPRRSSDLTIWRPAEIWARELGLDNRSPAPDVLDAMRNRGAQLWEKYEGKEANGTISRYLQHCTTFRIDFKEWQISEMMSDIQGLLEILEKHLPEFRPATNSK